jgi:enamine deaminase RidA (YjgF/YER057c/UK114 family)
VVVEDILYLSGVIGEKEGMLVEGGIENEAHQAMKNIEAVLRHYDLNFDSIFKCLVMIDDISQWGSFNSIYTQYFKRPYPVRSAFGADGLALNASFEIECMAKFPMN